jgi:hypothetical protein
MAQPKDEKHEDKKVDAPVQEAPAFLGNRVDPRDKSEYSLESGPDSPPAVSNSTSRIEQPVVKENS